jgi:hypothetical protein
MDRAATSEQALLAGFSGHQFDADRTVSSWHQYELLFEHDLIGKPRHTFPDRT